MMSVTRTITCRSLSKAEVPCSRKRSLRQDEPSIALGTAVVLYEAIVNFVLGHLLLPHIQEKSQNGATPLAVRPVQSPSLPASACGVTFRWRVERIHNNRVKGVDGIGGNAWYPLYTDGQNCQFNLRVKPYSHLVRVVRGAMIQSYILREPIQPYTRGSISS
jgi:hypothetical protein